LLCSLLLRSVGPKSGISTHEWNKGFEHVARLEQLEELDLKQSGVDDSGLRHIAEGCPDLIALTISFCDYLSPAGLRHLGKLIFLSYLDMSEWKGFQLCGPWQDSFLDGLVDRLEAVLINRAEEGEEEEEGEEWTFSLQYLDLTSTACTRSVPSRADGGRLTAVKPGPNVRALREAGVHVKMGGDE
jgi:hypothetical protein